MWQIRVLNIFIRLGGLFLGKRIVSQSLRIWRQVRVPPLHAVCVPRELENPQEHM